MTVLFIVQFNLGFTIKAIAYCGATDEFILIPQHIEKDASVVALKEIDTFIEKAKSREWDREPNVRDLA